MKQVSRREIVKTMGLLPALPVLGCFGDQGSASAKSATSGARAQSPCSSKAPRVIIVLHGMQALIFDQTLKQLLIVIPNVPGHAYACGDFGAETLLDPASAASPYSLTGVTGGGYAGPAAGATDSVVIDWTNSKITSYGDAPYCVFRLPFPDCLVPLRVYQPTSIASGNTATQNSLASVTSVSLINALIYTNVVPGASITLAGVQLTPDTSGITHAHIISEPPFGAGSMHQDLALSKLNALFSPALDLQIGGVGGILASANSSEPGISNLELQTSEELRLVGSQCGATPPRKSHDLAGRPRNCMPLYVLKR